MNYLQLITTLAPLLFNLPSLLGSVQAAYNSATGNTLQKVMSALEGSASQSTIKILQSVGAELFPSVAPELQAAAAILAMPGTHPSAIAYIQEGLNLMATGGVFALPGNVQLAVDGIYGPKTAAAVNAFETHFGLNPNSFPVDLLNSAIAKI